MLYQGRFDKNKPNYEAALKAWNLVFNAAPKKNIVSAGPSSRRNLFKQR